MNKCIISFLISASLMAHEITKPVKITASDIISQAYVTLGDILHDQASIRTENDFEKFKTKNSEMLLKMNELAVKVPEAAKLSDFERREAIGIAMRYRYELFPPSPNGNPYLKEVPEKFHGELQKIANEQPPEIANLWQYITELTTPLKENSFLIPIGTEKIDPSITVVVSLGRSEEKPKLAVDPETRKATFVDEPQYIEISVEALEANNNIILYSQHFSIPKSFEKAKFKVTDAIKIDREARTLTVIIPEIEHTYKLPAMRPQD